MQRWSGSLAVLVLAALAGLAAYFGTKSVILEGKLRRAGEASSPSAVTPSPTGDSVSATATPTAATETGAASPPPPAGSPPPEVAAKDRLSQPAQIYTVVAGDTLYPIGLKYEINWEKIAEANGLAEPYRLSIGQVLAIPVVDQAKGVFEVQYSTDQTQAQTYQTQVNAGRDAWRLDPVASAQAELAGAFGLSAGDDYRLANRDDGAGTAVVTATRLEGSTAKSYEIRLRQPVTKGSAGIWVLSAVAPKK